MIELFKRMLARSAPVFNKISRHPFHLQLFNGTLPKQTFERFAEQDAKYLAAYAKGLKRLAERCDDRHLAQQFIWFAEEIIQSEINIQTKYLRKPTTYSFFSRQPYKSVEILPVVHDYINHLSFAANRCEIEVALSAFATCPWLYNKVLGKLIEPNQLINNQYSPWLQSYSGVEFTNATDMLIQTIHGYSRTSTCPVLQERMIRAFHRSAEYELVLYDTVLTDASVKQQTLWHVPFQKK